MDQRRPGWQVVGSVLIVGLLGASTLELHAVESRLVTQSLELRALGETTERVAAQLEHLRSAPPIDTPSRSEPDAALAGAALAEVRHPELKNFLGAKGTHWPPPGAKTTGGISVDFPRGDPKGFNQLLENGQDLVEKVFPYVLSAAASRNEWTDPNVYYGDLAWRVEVQDNFKTFTIYLRKGVKWHPASGVDLNSPRYAWLNKEHLLTAHDFVFMFDMLMNPQVQNGFAKSYYSELASWKALDDYTLELRWNKTQELNVDFSLQISPLPKFLFAYQEDGSPIPEATLGVNFNQHWYNNKGLVGTGPYRFARYAPGSQIVLARNEDFYGDHPALASITYPIYSDPAQTALKLKSGELDFGMLRWGQYNQAVLQYANMPESERPKDYPFLNGDILCDLVDYPVYYYIGWNEANPLFADARVRRAMTLALNRQELVGKVFFGMGHVATGPFLESSGHLDPEIGALPFDLKQAAKLLGEAGWKDTDGDGLLDKAIDVHGGKRKPFEFSLLIYASNPEMSSAAAIFKEDLLSIGVKMNIESAEWGLMQKRMDDKKFDAYTGGWGVPWDQDPYQIWHSSQADVPKGSNRVGFRNKEADELIEKLRVTLDHDERTRMFHALHRIIDAEQPYTFMLVPKFGQCHRRGIENVTYAKIIPLAYSLPWWNSRQD